MAAIRIGRCECASRAEVNVRSVNLRHLQREICEVYMYETCVVYSADVAFITFRFGMKYYTYIYIRFAKVFIC